MQIKCLIYSFSIIATHMPMIDLAKIGPKIKQISPSKIEGNRSHISDQPILFNSIQS